MLLFLDEHQVGRSERPVLNEAWRHREELQGGTQVPHLTPRQPACPKILFLPLPLSPDVSFS